MSLVLCYINEGGTSVFCGWICRRGLPTVTLCLAVGSALLHTPADTTEMVIRRESHCGLYDMLVDGALCDNPLGL